MKGRRLAWTIYVCYGNTVGGVARGFGYLTHSSMKALLKCNVDSRHPLLEVLLRAALGAALPPVSGSPFSWTEAASRTIAAVTGVMANLLTVKAFDRTWTLLLSEPCAAA